MIIVCEVCNKEFYKRPSHYKRVKHHYCNGKCRGLAQKGDNNPAFKESWIKICEQCKQEYRHKDSHGKKYCSRKCMGFANRGKKVNWVLSGKDSVHWKGENVGYSGLHFWVTKNLGRPNKCEFCGKIENRPRFIHWANKSGEYKRKLTDWIRLCAKCHKVYDNKNRQSC